MSSDLGKRASDSDPTEGEGERERERERGRGRGRGGKETSACTSPLRLKIGSLSIALLPLPFFCCGFAKPGLGSLGMASTEAPGRVFAGEKHCDASCLSRDREGSLFLFGVFRTVLRDSVPHTLFSWVSQRPPIQISVLGLPPLSLPGRLGNSPTSQALKSPPALGSCRLGGALKYDTYTYGCTRCTQFQSMTRPRSSRDRVIYSADEMLADRVHCKSSRAVVQNSALTFVVPPRA